MIVRTSVFLAVIALLAGAGTVTTIAAPALDCPAEALALSKAQSELPKLEFTSPADKPPYCITLETIMAFAGRVRTHVAHCPQSEYAASLPDWARTQTDYSKLFSRYRCKRTF
jgi:hypothetical protein